MPYSYLKGKNNCILTIYGTLKRDILVSEDGIEYDLQYIAHKPIGPTWFNIIINEELNSYYILSIFKKD